MPLTHSKLQKISHQKQYFQRYFQRYLQRYLPWLIRFVVMAIALILSGDAIGRLGFSALGQIPGTTPWNYAVLLYAGINISAIITPKVKQPMGLIPLGFMTVHTMTTYAAAFANMTIGLMAISVGKSWGGIFLIVGGICLIATSNRLCRLVQNFRRP